MALDCDAGLSTVHLIKPKLSTGDCLEEPPRSRRPETVRISEVWTVEAVTQSNNGDPLQSINGIADEFGLVYSTTRYQVKKYRVQQDRAPAHGQNNPVESGGGTSKGGALLSGRSVTSPDPWPQSPGLIHLMRFTGNGPGSIASQHGVADGSY